MPIFPNHLFPGWKIFILVNKTVRIPLTLNKIAFNVTLRKILIL